jgi:hypothetical protein
MEGKKTGGFVGLCSWLPSKEHIKTTSITVIHPSLLSYVEKQGSDLTGALSTPVFLSHCVDDEVTCEMH